MEADVGRMSRVKGKVGERELAAELRTRLGLDAQRSYHQSRDGTEAPDVDVAGLPIWAECKRMARPAPVRALEQAERDCGARPLWPVAFTRADRAEWLVTMRQATMVDIVRELVPCEVKDHDEVGVGVVHMSLPDWCVMMLAWRLRR